MSGESIPITQLLRDAGKDEEALNRLLEALHRELHDRAVACMRGERPDHTLQPTALLNEAYLRLRAQNQVTWGDRRAFFAFASKVMRHILVDHARARRSKKRGSGGKREPLHDYLIPFRDSSLDLIALDDALRNLEKFNPRVARVVEMKFFGELSAEEIAAALDVTARTVNRDLRLARCILYDEMKNPGDS